MTVRLKILFSAVGISALMLIAVLYSKNWIYPRCQATGTVLSEEELLQNFLDDVLADEFFINGRKYASQIQSQIEDGAEELVPFSSGEEYLRVANGCCQLGRTNHTYPGDTVASQLHDPPWYMRSTVRGLVSWKPAMMSLDDDGNRSAVYWNYTRGTSQKTFFWTEDWMDHCGRWLPVPIPFMVG